jgi:hypothetical protein
VTADQQFQLDRIEKDRKKREQLLLLLLLSYSDKALSQARSAIRTGGNPIQAVQQTIQGTNANVSHVHWKPLQTKLLPLMVETCAAGFWRAAKMADVSVDLADLQVSPSVQQGAMDLAQKTSDALARVTVRGISLAEQNGLNVTKTEKLLGETFKAAGFTRDNPSSLEYGAERAVVNGYGGGMFEAWETKAADRVTGLQHFSILDRVTTIICRQRNGLKLPARDPYWRNNWPQLHGRCRSVILPLFGKFAPSATYPTVPPMPGFGQAPIVVFNVVVGR